MRFVPWTDLGSTTFGPNDDTVVIGSFSMEPDQDTIWIKMTQVNADGPWPWSYGILGFKTSFGYELGTIKCYSQEAGEVFRLGEGLQPLERSGVLTFSPRSFNLAWIRQGNPWTLNFQAQSGKSSSGGGGSDLDSGTLGTFADSRTNNPLELFRVVFPELTD